MKMSALCVTLALALPLAAQAEDYFDCRSFDDKALCKELNRHPAVKDLPVFDTARIVQLYRSKVDYAEDVIEDHPLVVRGLVLESAEKSGRISLRLGSGVNDAGYVSLQLFPSHPIAAADGRVTSRPASAVRAALKPGTQATFQCVGDGLSAKVPVLIRCIYWE